MNESLEEIDSSQANIFELVDVDRVPRLFYYRESCCVNRNSIVAKIRSTRK